MAITNWTHQAPWSFYNKCSTTCPRHPQYRCTPAVIQRRTAIHRSTEPKRPSRSISVRLNRTEGMSGLSIRTKPRRGFIPISQLQLSQESSDKINRSYVDRHQLLNLVHSPCELESRETHICNIKQNLTKPYQIYTFLLKTIKRTTTVKRRRKSKDDNLQILDIL